MIDLKLIAIVITFIFIFDGTGYPLPYSVHTKSNLRVPIGSKRERILTGLLSTEDDFLVVKEFISTLALHISAESELNQLIDSVAQTSLSDSEKLSLLSEILAISPANTLGVSYKSSFFYSFIYEKFAIDVKDYLRQHSEILEITILDLGSGDGKKLYLYQKYLRVLGIKYSFAAIDYNEDFISEAKRINPDVQFYQCDLLQLDFQKVEPGLRDLLGKVDIVNANLMLHELYSIAAIKKDSFLHEAGTKAVSQGLRDIYLLLKPEGELFIYDGVKPGNPEHVVVIKLSLQYWAVFKRFADLHLVKPEYKIILPAIADNVQIEINLYDLSRFLDKLRWFLSDDPDIERRIKIEMSEIFQYWSQEEFLRQLNVLHFSLEEKELLNPSYHTDRVLKGIKILKDASDIPWEYIRIRAKKGPVLDGLQANTSTLTTLFDESFNNSSPAKVLQHAL